MFTYLWQSDTNSRFTWSDCVLAFGLFFIYSNGMFFIMHTLSIKKGPQYTVWSLNCWRKSAHIEWGLQEAKEKSAPFGHMGVIANE